MATSHHILSFALGGTLLLTLVGGCDTEDSFENSARLIEAEDAALAELEELEELEELGLDDPSSRPDEWATSNGTLLDRPPAEIESFCGAYNGNLISMRTDHNRYVRASIAIEDWQVDNLPFAVGPWERFRVECHGQSVAFLTHHNRYLTPRDEPHGYDLYQWPIVGPWELMTPIKMQNGKWAFLTHHGRFLRAGDGPDGWLIDQQTYIGPWEQFTVNPA